MTKPKPMAKAKLCQLLNQLGDGWTPGFAIAQEAGRRELAIGDLILKMLAPSVWSQERGGKGREITDTKNKNLIIRTNANGDEFLIFRKRTNGLVYKRAFGPGVTRAAARKGCEIFAGKIAAGQDPFAEMDAQAAAEKARLKTLREKRRNPQQLEEVITVSRLVKTWGLSPGPKGRERSLGYVRDTVALLERALAVAGLTDLPALELAPEHVAGMLARVGEKSGPGAQLRLRNAIGGVTALAFKNGIIPSDPCTKVERKEITERKRVLSTVEVQRIWRASFVMPRYGSYVRTLARTAMRRDEVLRMRRSEINGDVWIVPADRMKSRRDFAVPISPELLADLPPAGLEGDHVFGINGASRFPSTGRIKAALDAAIASDDGPPVPPWTLHDLRRSFVTQMADRGEDWALADLCLAHVPAGLSKTARTYQRSI